MNTVKKTEMNTNKKVTVEMTGKLKQLALSYGTPLAAGAAVVSGVAFVSANYLSPITEGVETPISECNDVSIEEIKDNEGCYIQNECMDVPVVADTEDVSFDQIFSIQRESQGAGGIFEYKGKLYNTYLKEEWESMTEADKNIYYGNVGMNINTDESKIIVSQQDGQIATLSYNSDTLMTIEVVDVDDDGIVDVVSVDVDFDNNSDFEYTIEREEVHPDIEQEEISDDVVIDAGSDITLVPEEDIVDVETSDIISDIDEADIDMSQDNLFGEQIGNYQLPGIIDDMNMDEFY